LQELQERLDANPQDVDAAAALAHAAIRSGDFDAGMRYVEAGRQVDPQNVKIQASLAALMIAIGMLDKAQQNLDEVQARDPNLATAWLWRGVLELNRGNLGPAEAALSKALDLSQDAEDRRLAAMLLADARNPQAAAPAPEAAPEAPPAGPARLTGSLRIEGSAALPPEALVFVFVRPSVEGRGPPLAALRIPASSLPTTFALGDGDIIMQGTTWPDQVWLSARLDTDGNAATREEGQPAAEAQGPFSSGQTVELVLR
jgi:cytochrome c-type biogenesis protein CcmH